MGITPPIELANLSMADSLILMVMALVVFGPRRLPQIGRQIGKLMYEFRKASNDFKFQMEEELRASEEADRRKKEEEERLRAAALAPPVLPGPPEPVSAPSPSMEAQADIGALESPTAASDTSVSGYPPETHNSDPLPTILPPSTGETVSRPMPPARHYQPAETNGMGNPAEVPAEEIAAAPPSSDTPTEPVSQHG